jgi:hypothetical protein
MDHDSAAGVFAFGGFMATLSLRWSATSAWMNSALSAFASQQFGQ